MYTIWVWWELRQQWTPEIDTDTAAAALRAMVTLRRETEGPIGGVWFPGCKVRIERRTA
jgi:hypothetical protein